MKEIDCDYTDETVCPYCGHENRDSWELREDSGEDQCGECEKNFLYFRNVSVDYSTKKADCLNGSPHKFSEWDEILTGLSQRSCKDCGKRETRREPTKESEEK